MRLLTLFLLACAAVGAAETPSKQAREQFEAAQLAAKHGQTGDAIQRYQKAVALAPSFSDAWYELGGLQLSAGQNEAARKSYESAILGDRRFYEAYLKLAELAQQASGWPQVVEIVNRLLKIDSVDYPEAFLYKATALYRLGDLDAAVTTAQAGRRIDYARKHPGLLRLLGVISAARGDHEAAETQLSDYLQLAPDAPDAAATRQALEKVRAQHTASGTGGSVAAFRSDAELAVVRFKVNPKKGQSGDDLRPADIEIREDGVPQRVAAFEGGRLFPRVIPLEITLLFDCSESVRANNNLNPYIFHENLLDEFENASLTIYGFSASHLARLISTPGPTRRPRVLKEAMDAIAKFPTGRTQLFDAISETANRMSNNSGAAKVLVVMSDGIDSSMVMSTHMMVRASRIAQEGGVTIYPVLLLNPDARLTGSILQSVTGFLALAEATGGAKLSGSRSPDMLARVLRDVSARLKSDYVAGYYPSAKDPGKRRQVEVVLKSSDRGQIVGGKRIVIR